MLWGLNADTGAKVWGTLVGPGSSLGGLEWGSATDGDRIYFAVVNLDGVTYPMANPPRGHTGHLERRQLGRGRPGDRENRVADRRPERRDRPRPR